MMTIGMTVGGVRFKEVTKSERQYKLMYKILTRIDNWYLGQGFVHWSRWAGAETKAIRLRRDKARTLRKMANAALNKGWEGWMQHYRASLRAQRKIAQAGLSAALAGHLEAFQKTSAARMAELHTEFLSGVQKEISSANESMTLHAASYVGAGAHRGGANASAEGTGGGNPFGEARRGDARAWRLRQDRSVVASQRRRRNGVTRRHPPGSARRVATTRARGAFHQDRIVVA